MRITKIQAKNFRILQNSVMDFDRDICLLLGRNNTGKTSFMVLIEKFLKNGDFNFNDFSVNLRSRLFAFDETTDENELAIQLIITVTYDENDNLCHLSEFILDLDPECKTVNLLFECSIKKEKLLEGIKNRGKMPKDKFITNHIKDYLQKKVFTFNSMNDFKTGNRYRLIEKEFKEIEKLIDFEIIHAKRSVTSSEEKNGTKVLSKLTTDYFNHAHINTPDKFENINTLISQMDEKLGCSYDKFFNNFLANAKEFLSMGNLKVVSNLKAKEIVNDSSEVVYGDLTQRLPEHLNGLGHMNILFLLLSIEIKKEAFKSNNKDIKLLLIEEPEAHTHPQIQNIFAQKIEKILSEIPNMQTIISTHSPHIVAKHPFENIRYMSLKKGENSNNVEIKNFYNELSKKYVGEEKEFAFLTQYLSLQSAELFFADKAIFIEGISEGILIDYFFNQYDAKRKFEEAQKVEENLEYKSNYIPLSSQNVTVIQVGANAKAFRHFIEFLEIPTLIITDIDTVYRKVGAKKATYPACSVSDSECCNISNETIKYYYAAPKFVYDGSVHSAWLENIKKHSQKCISDFVNVSYQCEENGYYPRSFEDAFINVNLAILKKYQDQLLGLINKDEIDTNDDIYNLTQEIIHKKSDFASSLLYIAYTDEKAEWTTPKYIWEGLEWLQTR